MRAATMICLAALLGAPAATADDAAALFQRGLAAFTQGDTAKACALFEQSYRIGPATGTLFNLATCHAREGRYWEARGEFLRLASEMDGQGKAEKARIARDEAADAEQHVPKLALAFPDHSNVETIQVDGHALDAASWKAPIPVAPGSHVVTFTGAGFEGQTRTAVAAGDSTASVAVPVLSRASSPAPPGRAGTSGQGTPPRDRTQGGWTGQQTTGAIVAGVGVVALGVGGVFGLMALSQKSDADSACGGSGGACIDAAHARAASDQIHTAQATARISTIAIGGGLVALGVGAYLLVTGQTEPARPPPTALCVTPVAGRAGAGVSFGGRF